MTEPTNMIPMAILTGYLGAGKTTLLNRILNSNHQKRIAVLVNDFGAINIDAKIIVGVEGETITLSNGCICCTIRGDMVEAIAKLVKNDNPPEYIIIEASGVSDPAQIVLTFNRSFLRSHVQIDSIIAMFDAEQFLTLHEKPEKLLREQVRVSDIVIINKTDLVTKAQLADARKWIEGIIDKARILETTYADVPVEALIGNASYNPQTAFDTSGPGVHAHDVNSMDDHEHNLASLVFATWSWESDEAVSITAIRAVLDELPKTIFRAKGVIYAAEIPDKQVVLQVVGPRVAFTEGADWAELPRRTSIVLIGDMGSVDRIALQEQFDQTIADTKNTSELSQMVDGVLKWLRVKS